MDIIYSYIYDFLSVVLENCKINKYTKNIILFGSVARGKFDKKSDIDLFFDIKNKSDEKFLEESLGTSLKSFEVKSSKTWRLKGINLPIKFLVGDLNSEEWKSLKEDIISNGVSLFGKFETLPERINHYALFYFSLEKLKRKDKMKFLRKMFGYTNIKSKKLYVHKGYLEKMEGIKLGPNTILFPLNEVENVKSIFKKFKITPKIIEVWIRDLVKNQKL